MVFDKTGVVTTDMGVVLVLSYCTVKAKDIKRFCVNDC